MKATLSDYWWERDIEDRKGNKKIDPNDSSIEVRYSKVSYLRTSRSFVTLPGQSNQLGSVLP